MASDKCREVAIGPGMAPWSSQCHIAQRWCAERIFVGLNTGYTETAFIPSMRFKPRALARAQLRLAHSMKPMISQKRPTMATGTTCCTVK